VVVRDEDGDIRLMFTEKLLARTQIVPYGSEKNCEPRSESFEPLLIAKGQERFEGFDERIIAMYARGMTMGEIAGFLLDQYKVQVSAGLSSAR
jgi:hypothetical protein